MEKIHITTGARLHFGLLDVRPPFGGIGVMVQTPPTVIRLLRRMPESPHSRLVEKVIERIRRDQKIPPSLDIRIESMPRRHMGLGSGTQAAMGVAEAIAMAIQCVDDGELISKWSGRGRRSRIGSIGYSRGGLIAESGDEVMQTSLPDGWRILIATPLEKTDSISGDVEDAKFQALRSPTAQHRGLLTRSYGELLSAATSADFDHFSHAVFQYNQTSGELFAPVQFGVYQSRPVEQLVRKIRELGIIGVGQSSWGPGVFAFCRDQSEADALSVKLAGKAEIVAVTSIRNQGRYRKFDR